MDQPEERTAPQLKHRYFYKLSSNVVTILMGICTSAIVPRALGVSTYGNYSFVNNVITQVLNFLDMRASTFFYVRLSQKQKEPTVITFYGIYNILVFAVLAAIVLLLTLPALRPWLFEDIDGKIIWLSFLFVCAKWMGDIFIKISDAYGTTIFVERIKMVNNVLSVVVLVVLFTSGLVTITTFYLLQILIFALLCLLIYRFFKRNKYAVPLLAPLKANDRRFYTKSLVLFSSPLTIYLAATLITEVFDRAILQHFHGSYQQGLYGFSFSLSATTILFVTSMVPLFMRELSIAFGDKDLKLAASLYRKYVPIMYIVSAYFCCFMFANVEGVILLFGGDQYAEAFLPLRIMMIHPLVSTYSNLNSSVIYAKKATTFVRNLVLWTAPSGMLISFLLVSDLGLNMGATGVALKVTLVEFVSTFLMLLHIAKYLKMNALYYLGHMVVVPVVLIGVSLVIKHGLLLLYTPASDVGKMTSFLVSGGLYTLTVALIFYFFPIFAGLTRAQIHQLVGGAINKISRRK